MQTVRVEMGVELAPELQSIINNADESAIWMYEKCKKPFFPEDVQWVREKLAQTRTPVRENIQKRALSPVQCVVNHSRNHETSLDICENIQERRHSNVPFAIHHLHSHPA